MLSFSPSKPKRRSIWDETGVPQRGNRLQKAIEQGLPYSAHPRMKTLLASIEESPLDIDPRLLP